MGTERRTDIRAIAEAAAAAALAMPCGAPAPLALRALLGTDAHCAVCAAYRLATDLLTAIAATEDTQEKAGALIRLLPELRRP